MSAVFADTSFFLALLRDGDLLHARAISEAQVNRPILTTEFILLELGNACARAEDHADYLALVASLRSTPRFNIVPLSSELLNEGLQLMGGTPGQGLVTYRLH